MLEYNPEMAEITNSITKWTLVPGDWSELVWWHEEMLTTR